ncbi:N-6 DNA methylase [Actinocorallia lasiicapitis]
MNEKSSATVTAADIARLTGFGRAAVSNWRRRYDDFPQPVGGTASSPQFALADVEEWLVRQGKTVEVSAEERLWQQIRSTFDDLSLAQAVADLGERLLGSGDGPFAAELAGLAREKGAAETFEFLLDRFVEAHARRVATTPRETARLMAELTEVAGASVLDPSCGIGTLLTTALDHGAGPVHGQDRDQASARMSRARLALRTDTSQVREGDSLRDDAFPDLAADVVLCDPPFADRGWGYDELTSDPRWAYGLPPRGEPELAWVQHALARTKPGGRVAVLMPAAAADRRSGRRIRSQLLRSGALRAVFELPAGTASGSPAGPHLWVLRRPDGRAALPSRLLLADLSQDDAFGASALALWREFADRPELERENGRGIPIIDLLDDVVDVTPSRHVVHSVAKGLDFGTARNGFRELLAALGEAVSALDSLVHEDQKFGMTTVTELLQSGAVSVRQSPIRLETGKGAVPVLTAQDVILGREPSELVEDTPGLVMLERGDVVVPMTSRQLEPQVMTRGGMAAGPHLQVFRPEPSRCDPYFLACFLRASGVARSGATNVSRADGRRAPIPRLPIEAQRPYGEAFRRLQTVSDLLRTVGAAGETFVGLGYEGLAGGVLRPE